MNCCYRIRRKKGIIDMHRSLQIYSVISFVSGVKDLVQKGFTLVAGEGR